jgi:hypothetical protein
LKLSILAGYAPQLDVCSSCATDPEEAPEPLSFAPDLGGVLCSECRSEYRSATGDAFPLASGTLERLRALIERPIREVIPENGLGDGVLRVVRSHVLAHAPGNAIAGTRLRGPRRLA